MGRVPKLQNLAQLVVRDVRQLLRMKANDKHNVFGFNSMFHIPSNPDVSKLAASEMHIFGPCIESNHIDDEYSIAIYGVGNTHLYIMQTTQGEVRIFQGDHISELPCNGRSTEEFLLPQGFGLRGFSQSVQRVVA